MNHPVSPDAVARPRLIDADRLTLPLELLDYAHEKIFLGVERGHGDLQETMPCYIEIVRLAMDELHRLQDQALVEGQP